MTISTLPFLSGRTSDHDHTIRVRAIVPQRRGEARKATLRRFRRAEVTTVQRDHHRRVETDAYLDRTGLSSVDWLDALAHHAQR